MRRSALGTFKSTARRCQSFERIRLSPSTHGKSRPYTEDPAWEQEENAVLDREKTPDFAEKIAAMRADVVVDLISLGFEPKCTAPETSGIAVQSYIGRGLIRV